MKKLLILPLLFLVFTLKASTIDTLGVFSRAMQREIPCVVISPDKAASTQHLPVVYLLHGYGGSHRTWIQAFPFIRELSDRYGMILVCPNGSNSWYFDSPLDPSLRYETFITQELIPHIDRHYPTLTSREGRAIMGLSMGGHGALYLTLRHPDLFGAAGSMSGGVDIRPFPLNWEIAKTLGDYATHPENWEHNTVINLLHLVGRDVPALTIDCGTEDFFYEVNEQLHRELLYRRIPHEYTTRPGAHNYKYWSVSLPRKLLFFHEFFTKSNTLYRK